MSQVQNDLVTEHVKISDQEYKQRLELAIAAASQADLDILLVNSNEADFANVRYFSGYWTLFEIAGVAIAPSTSKAALLIGPESGSYARDRSKLPNIHKMLEYRESADPAYPGVSVSNFKQVFEDLGVSQPKRIGIAGYLVTTAPVLDGLRAAFPDAQIVRADHILVKLRSIKSDAEIACQKRAFEISELAVEAVLEKIRPGMTELELVGVAQQAFYANGAEYEGHPTYVLSGPNSCHAISRPTHRKLRRGELVQLNIGARVDGYASSVGLPVCIGKLNDRQRRLVAFGLEAHEETFTWMLAGTPASEIAKRYHKLFTDRGFESNFLYGPCHGLGLVEVEPPWVEATSDYTFKPNMTFQVDTFLHDEDFGLRWENGVRITAGEPEPFSSQYRRMIEID